MRKEPLSSNLQLDPLSSKPSSLVKEGFLTLSHGLRFLDLNFKNKTLLFWILLSIYRVCKLEVILQLLPPWEKSSQLWNRTPDFHTAAQHTTHWAIKPCAKIVFYGTFECLPTFSRPCLLPLKLFTTPISMQKEPTVLGLNPYPSTCSSAPYPLSHHACQHFPGHVSCIWNVLQLLSLCKKNHQFWGWTPIFQPAAQHLIH